MYINYLYTWKILIAHECLQGSTIKAGMIEYATVRH